MLKKIKIQNFTLEYDLKNSGRAKNLRLAIYPGGQVLVIKPRFLPQIFVNRFLKQKKEWLEKNIIKAKEKKDDCSIKVPRRHRASYLKYKEEVREFVKQTLEKYNKFYGFKYNQIRIKNQKTRWGSCSEDGNLNLSYRLKFLPKHFAEYIVVHELCHLGELNHSKRFWALVKRSFPDYLEVEKILKKV